MVPQNVNRSSQYTRKRTPMNPARNAPANIQPTNYSSTQLVLSKKPSAIEVRFKEEKFSGTTYQCIDLTLRNLHICANNHSPSNDERCQLVVSSLKGGASEFYLKEINPQITHQIIVYKQRTRYKTLSFF